MTSPCGHEQRRAILRYLEERFRITKSKLGEFELYDSGNGRINLGPKRSLEKPGMVSVGLLIARVERDIKPTTNLFQTLGYLVERNVVLLQKEQAIKFLKGEDLTLNETEVNESEKGYVLVRYGKSDLGCALLSGTLLRNMVPKSKILEIRHL